jgi:hypothetical protein
MHALITVGFWVLLVWVALNPTPRGARLRARRSRRARWESDELRVWFWLQRLGLQRLGVQR